MAYPSGSVQRSRLESICNDPKAHAATAQAQKMQTERGRRQTVAARITHLHERRAGLAVDEDQQRGAELAPVDRHGLPARRRAAGLRTERTQDQSPQAKQRAAGTRNRCEALTQSDHGEPQCHQQTQHHGQEPRRMAGQVDVPFRWWSCRAPRSRTRPSQPAVNTPQNTHDGRVKRSDQSREARIAWGASIATRPSQANTKTGEPTRETNQVCAVADDVRARRRGTVHGQLERKTRACQQSNE